MRDRFAGIAFGRDNAHCALISDQPSDFGAAVCLIGDNRDRRFIPVQKGMHHLAIMDIAARYGEPQGTAMCIYSGVNFARATAA